MTMKLLDTDFHPICLHPQRRLLVVSSKSVKSVFFKEKSKTSEIEALQNYSTKSIYTPLE